MIVFFESCCIPAGWLYSAKSGYIRAKAVVFGKKRLYSEKNLLNLGKVVVFGQK